MSPPTTATRRKKEGISLKLILLVILYGVCCFYVGILVGAHSVTTEQLCSSFMQKADTELQKINELKGTLFEPRFPTTLGHVAAGMALVHRDNFTDRFDMGVPLDPSDPHNEDVIILYSNQKALPKNKDIAMRAESNHPIPRLDIETATENCDTLNIILAAQKEPRQCFAVMGQYRSYHIQKFMRLPEKEGEKLDPKAPLRYVNRGAQPSGRVSTPHPTQKQTMEYWDMLKNYLQNLDSVLEKLRPKAQKVAGAHKNTVTVMVCNFGQSELLMNWVCSTRARGLDTSGTLLFATDLETKELAESMGLTVFYDELTYGNMPRGAAKRYADETFTKMMMAKVYCVQQVMALGYDVFFQDVDVIWYQNPLQFFHNSKMGTEHEMYFQDDGSRGLFYAPYSANTGVYYVRNNARTRYFFNSLLLAGDLIMATHSHQITLVAMLSEHASVHGLKIKVLSRDTDEFPGGYAFHNRPEYMKQVMKGETKPFLFHMSWTANKQNKVKFFKQTGNWFLEDRCEANNVTEIIHGLGHKNRDVPEPGEIIDTCCPQNSICALFLQRQAKHQALSIQPRT